jgi:hypothetical protein
MKHKQTSVFPLLIVTSCLAGSSASAGAAALAPSAAGLTVSVDESTGAYTVGASKQGWTFGGTVGERLSQVATGKGRDKWGAYQEVTFRWGSATKWSGSIRSYASRPLMAFAVGAPDGASGPTPDFPNFTTFPQALHNLSFEDGVFSPPTFRWANNATPWILFDDKAHTAVLSSASDFIVSQMHGDGKALLASGLNPKLSSVPAGFTHRTIFVVGQGVNQTTHVWGDALTDWSGKPKPTENDDLMNRYFGYWTDNGANYYYNYDRDKGYTGTLLAVNQHYQESVVPIHYLQLDSWWYQKSKYSPSGELGKTKNANLPEGTWNAYGGTMDYTAAPELFPNGLSTFRKELGLPLTVHARWIDPSSSYTKAYKISGVAAVDPRWWDDRMSYLKENGVICYEQDWLNEIYNNSPEMASTLEAGPAFADNMARSAKENSMTLQYCMATPRFFMQGSNYPNLTTIRTSEDRFERGKWNKFLYTSMLADSLRMRPWADVFMSTEMGNLTLATMSAGPVGVGDLIAKESRENLLTSVRADGAIVKPDAPLTPIDSSILSDARGEHHPLVATTYTDNGVRTNYAFAYTRNGDAPDVTFTPAELGAKGDVYLYNTIDKAGKRLKASETYTGTLGEPRWATYVIAPIGRSGIALLGDAGKIVPTGRRRLPSIKDENGRLIVTVAMAPGEQSVTLQGYAAFAPTVTAENGSASSVSYDAATGLFTTVITPATDVRLEKQDGDPVHLVTVTFTK